FDSCTTLSCTLSLHVALPISTPSQKNLVSREACGRIIFDPSRSSTEAPEAATAVSGPAAGASSAAAGRNFRIRNSISATASPARSEEHTSELQSRFDLVCRLL